MKIKDIDHLVRRIKQKAKKLEQEILQDCSEAASSYVASWTRFSSFNVAFFVVFAVLFLTKKNLTFHLLP